MGRGRVLLRPAERPDERVRMRIHSIVGLILFAVEVLEPETLERVPEFSDVSRRPSRNDRTWPSCR